MTSSASVVGSGRSTATREAVMNAAEQLFARHGVRPVSNRQIARFAGLRNNAAAAYYFPSRLDLVREIDVRHVEEVERKLRGNLADVGDVGGLDDWLACLVGAVVGHLSDLGAHSCYARFVAKAMSEPVYQDVLMEDALSSTSMRTVIARIKLALAYLPDGVRAHRALMNRMLLLQTLAEHELILAGAGSDVTYQWITLGHNLVDAMIGVWQAPVSPESSH
ncbi:hypothetical protein AB431_00860 [Mycobacterium sp. EPa45]|nr:hypothetical protein AB431_00860 [Mycobacterium sp. EPa45]